MDRVRLVQEDITRLEVDAIVNAANQRMLGGGGVDGAIHAAAGPELLEACRSIPETRPGVRCPVGESRITPGFELPARYVIHTVGPVWKGGDAGEAELLVSCYRSSLRLAREHGLESVAFPAISCGVFGYPLDKAGSVAVSTIQDELARDDLPRAVSLVTFGAAVHEAFQRALASSTAHSKGRS